MSIVVVAVLTLNGCGLVTRDATLLEGVEVPSIEVLGVNTDPEWIAYLEGQDYEIEKEFCDMNLIQEELEKILPAFLAKRAKIRSVKVVAIQYEAQTGDLNAITELDSVLTVDGEHYRFGTGVIPDGLKNKVTVRPDHALNLADAINNEECIGSYMRISGTLPENTLKFDVILRYKLRLGFSLF